MAKTLRPIKVKITRTVKDGKMQNNYPDFNQLSPAVRGNMDWSYYVDEAGIGWHYSIDGFGEGAEPDVQYGILAVPQAFADAAVAMYPSEVTVLNETELEDFWNVEAHVGEPDSFEDAEVLKAIEAKRALKLVSSRRAEPPRFSAGTTLSAVNPGARLSAPGSAWPLVSSSSLARPASAARPISSSKPRAERPSAGS